MESKTWPLIADHAWGRGTDGIKPQRAHDAHDAHRRRARLWEREAACAEEDAQRAQRHVDEPLRLPRGEGHCADEEGEGEAHPGVGVNRRRGLRRRAAAAGRGGPSAFAGRQEPARGARHVRGAR